VLALDASRLGSNSISLPKPRQSTAKSEDPRGGADDPRYGSRAREPLGRHALRFTGEDARSRRRLELVALPDGGAFDLLGMSG
jgi:hypothetical protein